VLVSGGGTCTLYDLFTCQSLQVFNGVLTSAGTFTILLALDVAAAGGLTLGGDARVGSSFANAGTITTTGGIVQLVGTIVSVTPTVPTAVNVALSCSRVQLTSSGTLTALIVQPGSTRKTPLVVQFLAGGNFTIANLDVQADWPEAVVQFLSSVAGTQYNLNVTVITSKKSVWPRDCNYSGAAWVGDLSNRSLGNNTGMTLNTPNGGMIVITEDPGADLLADADIGEMSYCWLVDTSVVNLTARVAAFLAGGNNWHRRTRIPLAFLDNMAVGTTYYVGLGLMDDRNRRVAPNMIAGDYISGNAGSLSGGGGPVASIVNSPRQQFGG
jgi:hypothetical protein